MYSFLGNKLIEEYGSLNDAFENFVMDEELIEELDLPKKQKETLIKIISEKIRPPEVEVQAVIELKSTKSAGIKDIKEILLKLQKGNITITYISAPKYRISIKTSDYKTAEGILNQLKEDSEKMAKEKQIQFNFNRIK